MPRSIVTDGTEAHEPADYRITLEEGSMRSRRTRGAGDADCLQCLHAYQLVWHQWNPTSRDTIAEGERSGVRTRTETHAGG